MAGVGEITLGLAVAQLLVTATKQTRELLRDLKSAKVNQPKLESKLQGYIEFLEELEKTKCFIDSPLFKRKVADYTKLVEELGKRVSKLPEANILKKQSKMNRIMAEFTELEKIQKDIRDIANEYHPIKTIQYLQGRRFWEKYFGRVRAVTLDDFISNFEEQAYLGGYPSALECFGGLLRYSSGKMVYINEFDKFVSVLGAKSVNVYEENNLTSSLVCCTSSISQAVKDLKSKGKIKRPLKNGLVMKKKLTPVFVNDHEIEEPTQEQRDAALWMKECCAIFTFFWDNDNITDIEERLEKECEGTYLMRYSTNKPKTIRLLVRGKTGIKRYELVCKPEPEEFPITYTSVETYV